MLICHHKLLSTIKLLHNHCKVIVKTIPLVVLKILHVKVINICFCLSQTQEFFFTSLKICCFRAKLEKQLFKEFSEFYTCRWPTWLESCWYHGSRSNFWNWCTFKSKWTRFFFKRRVLIVTENLESLISWKYGENTIHGWGYSEKSMSSSQFKTFFKD